MSCYVRECSGHHPTWPSLKNGRRLWISDHYLPDDELPPGTEVIYFETARSGGMFIGSFNQAARVVRASEYDACLAAFSEGREAEMPKEYGVSLVSLSIRPVPTSDSLPSAGQK